MLRSDFRFPLEGWPHRMLAVLLGEAFLGFLAIVAVGLTLFPMFFKVGARADAAIDTAQWIIIAWFAFEYLFAFASARAKTAFLTNPWRLLDAATVAIPFASLWPSSSHALLSSPALRLVRLTRLVALGVRVGGVAARHRQVKAADEPTAGPVQIARVASPRDAAVAPVSWTELRQWLRAPAPAWYHVANPTREQLAEIAAAAGLPAGFLAAHLLNTSYPHVVEMRNLTALFLWVPETKAPGQVLRHGLLFLVGREGLLTLARRASHAVERLSVAPPAAEAADENDAGSFPLRVLARVLERVLDENEALIGSFEQELRALEDVPIRDSSPAFFERTFRVKKNLSAAQADLWRLKSVLSDFAEKRVALPDGAKESAEIFRRLAAMADYLYETTVNTRDEVVSVMELHLNIVSFDMNRVMRVLAVVSVLGLIPAVIGGLFGMNLVDNPWPFTLPQVAFSICFGMVVCLYLFFVKGWLR